VRDQLATVEAALHGALDGFDPSSLSDAECEHAIKQLAWFEKFCAAARLRAAAALRSRGDRNAAEKVGRATGASSAKAHRELDAVDDIDQHERTREAFDRGDISLQQADEIAKTANKDPRAEEPLLKLAAEKSYNELRDEARKRRLACEDPDDLYKRQRQARSFRHWRDDLGMVRFAGALPPLQGIPIINRLRAETDRVFRHAYREGRREPNECYAADALVNMLNDSATPGSKTRADVVIVVDIKAYRRGHAEPGEICDIITGGPIPVPVAQEMAKDGFLKAVLHDGVAIHTIKHFGRRIPAVLRTALAIGPPPDFDGEKCEHCGKRIGLEVDHIDPVANGGATEASNLELLCRCEHRNKTEADRARGLLVGRSPPGR
jgi:hypothetical protein